MCCRNVLSKCVGEAVRTRFPRFGCGTFGITRFSVAAVKLACEILDDIEDLSGEVTVVTE